jgi:hypothetical protein
MTSLTAREGGSRGEPCQAGRMAGETAFAPRAIHPLRFGSKDIPGEYRRQVGIVVTISEDQRNEYLSGEHLKSFSIFRANNDQI